MKSTQISLATACAISAFCCTFGAVADSSNAAHNWPEWRGPTGNGVALHGNPPVEWSEEKNVKWKVAIPGAGHATPIVWGDKIFVLTAIPAAGTPPAGTPPAGAQTAGRPQGQGQGGGGGGFDREALMREFDKDKDGELNEEERSAARAAMRERGGRGGQGQGRGRGGGGGRGRGQAPTIEQAFAVMCLDKNTGEVIWQQTPRKEVPHEGHHQTNTYASGSPVTDGEHVWAFFSSHGLFCYDMEGNLKWQKQFGQMRTRNGFGEGVSPTLAGDKLIVVWDTEDESWIAAFNKKTGEEIWKKERDEPTGWSTPYVLKDGDSMQVVVNGTRAVRSYDAQSGDLIWHCSGQTVNAIPTVVADDNMVYAMSGFRGNAAVAIQRGGRGDLTNSDNVKWKLDRGTPYVPSPLLYDGQLYFVQGNTSTITSVNSQSGKAHYQQERLDGIRGVYASPVGAAGRVYLAGREGSTVVLAKGPELKVLATNELDDPIDASPVVVGDQLFLRTHSHLYCIAE